MTEMRGKHIVVAGGAGFIGLHLSARLLDFGAEITIIDDLSTSCPEAVATIQTLGSAVRLRQHSVIETVDFEGDILFNLACPASPRHYQRDPIRTWKTSVLGTMRLAERAQALGMRFVQASTSEVYGDPLVHPQSEDYWGNVSTTGIRACYDEGKRAAETFLTDLSRTTGMDLRIARIFNTYGPGMAFDDGRVVSNFVVQALSGEALTVFGDGQQTRSMCFVDDLVRGLISLASSDAARGAIVNLGNPQEYTVLALAELVQDLVGSDVPLDFQPLPQHDPLRRCPAIERAKRLLGWSPRVDLRDGLSRTIHDFDMRLKRSITTA